MIRKISKALMVVFTALTLFAGTASAVYAESELISGFVVVLEDGILMDTELGEVVVTKTGIYEKLQEMDGSLITVEGVITEKDNGTLELKVNSIVE